MPHPIWFRPGWFGGSVNRSLVGSRKCGTHELNNRHDAHARVSDDDDNDDSMMM